MFRQVFVTYRIPRKSGLYFQNHFEALKSKVQFCENASGEHLFDGDEKLAGEICKTNASDFNSFLKSATVNSIHFCGGAFAFFPILEWRVSRYHIKLFHLFSFFPLAVFLKGTPPKLNIYVLYSFAIWRDF